MLFFSRITSLIGAASAVILSCVCAQASAQDDLIPIENFALRETIRGVQLSPSGEHIALMRIFSRDGNPIIEVYETADMSGRPVRIGSDRSEITNFQWVNDDRIYVSFRNRFRDSPEDVNEGVYASTAAFVSRDGGPFLELDEFVGIFDEMKTSEDEVLAFGRPGLRRRADGTFNREFGAPDLFVMDVNTGRNVRTIQSGVRYGSLRLDSQDRLRGGESFDAETRELVLYARDPGQEGWREFHRVSAETRENFSLAGFDPEDDYKGFVIANNGENTTGFYEFDSRSGQYGELLFRAEDSDIIGPVFSTRRNANREIVGVSYLGDNGWPVTAYLNTDEATAEAELHSSLEAVFPGLRVRVTSRSADDRYMVIFTQGPRDPGSYYLLVDGASLQPLGSQYPIAPEQLADMEYISYTARDGRTIHGYLTIPNGEGPFPLIVLPHGGPWVQEIVVYDEWSQLLASRGYMVLQPQFRGSQGYGLDHWTSSFAQWGLSMQDDMDDGALHLVEQGLADRDRLAMFGWSFGGYSALVASLREDQIYQCAISGAPVSDPIRFRANFSGGGLSRIQRALLNEGYDGVVPEDLTHQVNIPIMVVHGDDDQRVLIRHAEAFVDGLRRNNKPHKFVVLEGADHFSNTLFFDHQMELYTEMLSFLQNDCGPAGL